MAIQGISLSDGNLFSRLDTATYTNVDAVILKSLPSYCKQNTARIDHYVRIYDDLGNELQEVMEGDFDSASSIGAFSIGSANMVRIAFRKNLISDDESAKKMLRDYKLVFTLADTASYISESYDVKIYDLGTECKTFDSIVIGNTQLLALMASHIDIADLAPNGMNPFVIMIYPQITYK